jgi:glycerol-1-phosphate dehydrogenase [NAD(P)+]
MGGDRSAMERLARTLVLSGFGMVICGSSKPASQGEHLISHYADMLARPQWQQNLHGEQVAVTTLTMARLQQRALTEYAPQLRPARVTEGEVRAHFGPELGDSCWAEFNRKQPDEATRKAIHGRLATVWPAIRDRIAAVTRPAQQLHDILRRAGAPTTPADLGWPASFYRDAVLHAREIRDRWTFLDFAADIGALSDAAA